VGARRPEHHQAGDQAEQQFRVILAAGPAQGGADVVVVGAQPLAVRVLVFARAPVDRAGEEPEVTGLRALMVSSIRNRSSGPLSTGTISDLSASWDTTGSTAPPCPALGCPLPAATASAAARVKPPENTDSWRSTARSGSASRS
jgi:hypothetical protein